MDAVDLTAWIAELALKPDDDRFSRPALANGRSLIGLATAGRGSCADGGATAEGEFGRALRSAYRYGWVDFDFDPYDRSEAVYGGETGRKPVRGESIYRLDRCRNFRVTPQGRAAIEHLEDPEDPKPISAASGDGSDEPDFFICHAGEDKDLVARPLAEALRARGWRVWFDEFELCVGDSLRRQIDRGLATCRFGIVILSSSFLAKRPWSERELDGLTTREVSAKRSRMILPVWHQVGREAVAAYSPALADRVAASTDLGIACVVERLEATLVAQDAA